MRAAASLVALILMSGAGLAQAQNSDKSTPAQATPGKAVATPKATAAKPAAAATGARVSGEAGKAKIEGVSTMRSTPADGKKDGGCGHSMGSDA
jgi:hypothetical protein